jgi:hypothetical protein
MIGRQRRELERRLHEAERLLDRIDRNVDGIQLITLVREPKSPLAADAYEGLRKQVAAASGERAAHLHQLAQFDAARRAGASDLELDDLVREWMTQAQLEVVTDPAVPGAFELVGDRAHEHLHVRTPAYRDGVTHRIVRGGVAERVAPRLVAVPTAPAPEPEADAPAPEDKPVAAVEPNGDSQ